jgi:hypothetical protein
MTLDENNAVILSFQNAGVIFCARMTFRLAWREALRRFWKGGGSTDGAVPSKLRLSQSRYWQPHLC